MEQCKSVPLNQRGSWSYPSGRKLLSLHDHAVPQNRKIWTEDVMETALHATSEGMSVREASEGMSVTKEGAASGKEDYNNSHPHTVLTCLKALKDQAGEKGIHNSSLPASVKC